MLKRFAGRAVVGLLGWALLSVPSGAGIDLAGLGSTGSSASVLSGARFDAVTVGCCLGDMAFGPLIDPRGSGVDLAVSVGVADRVAFRTDIDAPKLPGDLPVATGAPDSLGTALGPYMDPTGFALW